MTDFDFGQASAEERSRRRADRLGCIQALRACKPLADRLAASPAGIYSELSETEEAALQNFHWVCDAHADPLGQFDGLLDQVGTLAGLRPSDMGLLSGCLFALYQKRQPEAFLAEVEASLARLLRRAEQPGKQR
jgi:hypothetical protein